MLEEGIFPLGPEEGVGVMRRGAEGQDEHWLTVERAWHSSGTLRTLLWLECEARGGERWERNLQALGRRKERKEL